jgi:hypothetical protein
MKIPKIIHYCWFGKGGIPEKEKACIASWSKVLPDYEIRLWNEDTFDIDNAVTYVQQAYAAKKYAFVSDYVRMYALYNFGGIYFDTDVEVIKPLDDFLNNKFFIGFENKTMLGTGIIGSQPNNWLLKDMLAYYAERPFVDKNNNYDITTNVQILVKILSEYGFAQNNKEQITADIHIYERDVFNPKKIDENLFVVTPRTVTIHKFSGSWLTDRQKRRGTNPIWRNIVRPTLKYIRQKLNRLLGEQKTKEIELRLRNTLK